MQKIKKEKVHTRLEPDIARIKKIVKTMTRRRHRGWTRKEIAFRIASIPVI